MSKICDICSKGYLKGNLVPRGVGRRVTKRTIMKQQPNLRNKRLTLGGNTVQVQICASCLKRLKKENIITNPHKKAETVAVAE